LDIKRGINRLAYLLTYNYEIFQNYNPYTAREEKNKNDSKVYSHDGTISRD